MKRVIMTCAMLGAMSALILGGCGESSTEEAQAPENAPTTAFVLAEMPDGAVDVAEAKRSAKEGDQVVVRGRIGGRAEPMSEESALFIMMDPAIPSCLEMKGDHCPQPWDYCCESPESIKANSATVQVMGDDGRLLPLNLSETAGLEPLDEVVVVGTVAPRPSEDVLVIHARGVHRVGG